MSYTQFQRLYNSSLYSILIFVLALNLMLTMSDQKIIIHTQSDLMSITEQILLKDPYVEIQGTSKYFTREDYQFTYLKFIEVGKNKRKAHQNFIRKYKKIINYLIKYQIVPHQTAMIQTGIQLNFINKKRVWQFSRVFVVYCGKKQLQKILYYLKSFNLIKLTQKLIIGYLNQKLIAIKAFTDAKTKLQQLLNKKYNNNNNIDKNINSIRLCILCVVDIEILGKRFKNQQDIQSELKKQHNFSIQKHQIQIQAINQNKKQKKYKDKDLDYFDEEVLMRVIFKLGQKIIENNLIIVDDQQISHRSDDSVEDVEDYQEIEASPDGQVSQDL